MIHKSKCVKDGHRDGADDNPHAHSCYLHPPSVTAHIRHTRTYHRRRGRVRAHQVWIRSFVGTGCDVVGNSLPSGTMINSPLCFSVLPPSLGENNEGTSAAFEGWLDSADSYSLRVVSGHFGVSPQLLEQLPVEDGRLGLPCYLSPQGPWGKGRGGYSQSHTRLLLHAESFIPLGVTGKWIGRLLVE